MTPYQDIRKDLQTGDLVFFSTRNPLGKFIQTVTQGRFDHVGIAIRLTVFGISRVFVLEETPNGRQLSNMSNRAADVVAYRPDLGQHISIISLYVESTGSPYSFWNAIIAGLNLPRRFRSINGNICSEMVAEYLEDLQFEIPDTLVHPSKLRKICSEIFEEV